MIKVIELKNAIICMCLFLFAGFILGVIVEDRRIKQEAIELGFAEYNSTNGNWQWKPDPASQLRIHYSNWLSTYVTNIPLWEIWNEPDTNYNFTNTVLEIGNEPTTNP